MNAIWWNGFINMEKETVMYRILFALLLGFTSVSHALTFSSVCPSPDVSYCKHVGKSAFNAAGAPAMRKVNLGKITGVTWKKKGAVIGVSPAIPSAGIAASYRTSPRDAYYYIIQNGSYEPFIRQAREIKAK